MPFGHQKRSVFVMFFGKRPPRKTPDPLVLARQAEPFIDREIQQAVISGVPTVRLVREFSNASDSYVRAARAPEQEVYKITPMTVIICFVAIVALAIVAVQWVLKDPWNPPKAVLALQKIGDREMGWRNGADGKLTTVETQTRAFCGNRTKVQFSTPRTRIGEDRPVEEPVVLFDGFGEDSAASNAYTLCLIKFNVERLCDGDSVKHTAETLQGYFWSLDPMNGIEQSPVFGIMADIQEMQGNTQFDKVREKIGIDPEFSSLPKPKADPQIVSQVRNLMEKGYLRKSDLFFDLRGAPTGAKGLFDDVEQGKAPPCEKSA
jgi:hypothetical protein